MIGREQRWKEKEEHNIIDPFRSVYYPQQIANSQVLKQLTE